MENGGVHCEPVDLLDEHETAELLKRVSPDVLCHLAWAIGGPGFRDSEENMAWLEASLRLMRLFDGRRLIFAGSSSEYELGDSAGKSTLSLYGSSKLRFETVAGEYCREMGIRFASGRIFTVYGPGDVKSDAAIPSTIQAMLRGEPVRCNAPNNLWDYIYIDDAAEAMTRLVCSEAEGIMDIGTGRPTSMRQAFQTMAEAVGRPDLLACNGENPAGVRLVADTARMRQELGYTCQTSFAEGIARTVAWWREREK